MANVTVVVTPANGHPLPSATTDTNGVYTVTNVPIGNGTVAASNLPSGCTVSGPGSYANLTVAATDTADVYGSCLLPAFANEVLFVYVPPTYPAHDTLSLMSPNGTNVRRVSHDAAELRDPGWSPDGRRIVAGSYDSATVGWRLVAMDTNGTHEHFLSSGSTLDENPDWSPYGDKIAFTSSPVATFSDHIWVIDTSGANLTQLTYDSQQEAWPRWSPDGRTIAYESAHGGGILHVYLMNADGSNPHAPTSATLGDAEPAWSPDGTKIAFVSLRDGNDQIYVMNADGTGQTRLTHDTADDQTPTWSPDGTQIMFSQEIVNQLPTILIMSASDGSGLTLIRSDAAAPVWKHPPPPGFSPARVAAHGHVGRKR
jgi:tol-pal system beta propeller repeat protein TolB